MKKRIIGDSERLLWLLWIILTTIVAAWVASQFGSDKACPQIDDAERSRCHGERIAEANPLVLVLIVLGWVVITFLVPRWYLKRTSK